MTTLESLVNETTIIKNKIVEHKNNIKNKLISKDINVSSSENFKTLVDKVKNIQVSKSLPKWVSDIHDWWLLGRELPEGTAYQGVVFVNNKLYCFGGNNEKTVLNTSYYLDLTKNVEWQQIKQIPTGVYGFVAVCVNNKIYCIGGAKNGDYGTNLNQCYNISSNEWEAKANMLEERKFFTAQSVDDKIYCIGGYNNLFNYCYDTRTNTWSNKNGCYVGFSFANCSSAVVDSKIYCISGVVSNFTNVNKCYDTVTNTWTTKTEMPTVRSGLGSVAIGKKIYCMGGRLSGEDTEWGSLNTNECYDTVTDTWTTKKPLVESREGFGIATDGRIIYCVAGKKHGSVLSNVDCYIV